MIRFFLALCLLGLSNLYAQQGNTVYNFTNVPASALSSALAGSQVASAQQELSMIADNPAIGDSALHNNLNLGYLNYVGDINQATVGYSRIFDSLGLASAYLRYFDYGTFVETDEFGNQLGSFKVTDYELGISFSRVLRSADRIRYGATLKQVYSAYYSYVSYGLGIDLGAQYVSKDGEFVMGLVADNIGLSLVDYTRSGAKPMPFNVKLGFTKKFSKAPIRFGIQYNHLERWDLGAVDADAQQLVRADPLTGESTRKRFTIDNLLRHLAGTVEVIPSENFNLFVGYSFRRSLELALNERTGLAGFSLGALVRMRKFQLHYALASYTLGATSHMFAITTNLSEWYKRKGS